MKLIPLLGGSCKKKSWEEILHVQNGTKEETALMISETDEEISECAF